MWAGDLEREGNRVTFRVAWSGGEQRVFIDVPDGVDVALTGDVLLPAALLPAMALGEPDIVVDRAVDPTLASRVAQIQDVMLAWDTALRPARPKYRRVAVKAEPGDPPPDAAVPRGTACFFTGGVDSFYSVVSNASDLTALVYVHGLDIALEDARLYEQVAAHLRVAADSLGKRLIELRSNLRELCEMTGVGWTDYHGAALAAVAHLLAADFGRVLIPASWGYGHLRPWGSHPMLDPLWSSEAVEIVHDGAERNRLGKIRALGESPVAREHLRVCYRNYGQSYNCGVCEKCIRTAVATQIAGVADRFPTLGEPSVIDVARQKPGSGADAAWSDFLGDLKRRDAQPELQRAIETALLRGRLIRTIPGRTAGPRAAQIVWAARYPTAALARAWSKVLRRPERGLPRSVASPARRDDS